MKLLGLADPEVSESLGGAWNHASEKFVQIKNSLLISGIIKIVQNMLHFQSTRIGQLDPLSRKVDDGDE